MVKPQGLRLHKRSRTLEIIYPDGAFVLKAEFLRVYSPSAEVQGHGPGQAVLQWGKQEVALTQVISQGNYAVKLLFDDGHDSGIYTWSYLRELAVNQASLWQDYLAQLAQAGKSRDPNESPVRLLL